LWIWASLSIGAPLGNLEGGSYTRDLDECRRAPILGIPKDMLSKAPEMGICIHRGPTGEPGKGLIYQGLR